MTETKSETATTWKRLTRLLNQDILCALALLSLGAVAVSQLGTGVRNWVFPQSLTYVLLGIGVALAIKGARRWPTTRTAFAVASREQVGDVALFLAIATLYVLAMPWLGFWLPSFVMLAGTSIFLSLKKDRRTTLVSLAVGTGVCVLAYLLLLRVFFVPLPTGWLGGIGS